jgi:tripartite ATP-independent transporter DctP family solute receptor
MCIIGVPHFAAFVPEVAMTDLPYFWKGPEHFLKFWGSPTGKDFTSRYEAATKIKVLAVNWLTSYRQILAKKAVKNPADLRGVKIRVTQGFQHHYDGFLAMGASPVYMAFPEIYSALQQGVIDAMENPLEDMYTSKFHELAKYVSLTGHIFNSRTVQINAQTWAKLTPETQAIMTKAAEEAGEYQNEVVRRVVDEVKGKMAKEGITFVEADQGAFAERVRQQAHPKYIAKYTNGQALYDQIQGLVK